MSYPSALDGAPYNVSESDPNYKEFFDVGTPTWQRDGTASPLSSSEFDELEIAAFRHIEAFMLGQGLPEADEFLRPLFTRNSLGDFRGDRTLDLAIGVIDLVTPAFLQSLQQFLTNEFPDWRIRITAIASYCSILVYPDAVSIGRDVYEAKWQDALGKWVSQIDAAIGIEDVAIRREIRHVTSVVAKYLAELTSKREFRLLGAFHGWDGDDDFDCLWIWSVGESVYSYTLECVGESMQDRVYAVYADGSLRPVEPRSMGTEFWLQRWVVPSGTKEIQLLTRNQDIFTTISVQEVLGLNDRDGE